MASVVAFVILSRPHFLLGGALMYAVGAVRVGVEDLAPYLAGQALVTTAQLTAHYVNEYADVAVDRLVANRTMFSGGSGVLASGRLVPEVALRAAWASTIIALTVAGVVATISIPAALLGIGAISVSWAYSMPPLRLLNTGWGELATSIVVAVMVPVIGALVNGGPIPGGLAWATAMLLPAHGAMMLAFELPDLDSDREAGKTVLAVRIGYRSTVRAMAALLVSSVAVGLTGLAAEQLAGAWWLIAAALTMLATVAAAGRRRYAPLTVAAVAAFVLLSFAALTVP